ncbi:MAG: hypothetical protein WD471_01985 [Candidatus Paceibacterota bacterium]
MKTFTIRTGWIKFLLSWVIILIIRLIPFRPPNVEPILATLMPFSKRYSKISIFLFGFMSMVVLDFVMSSVGIWTLITGTAYGLLGLWSCSYFEKRKGNIKNFVVFSIFGTLAYDFVTGLLIGPIFFGQPFLVALIGQIPFTLNHLVGNIAFAVILSPIIQRWIVRNEKLEVSFIKQKLFGVSV